MPITHRRIRYLLLLMLACGAIITHAQTKEVPNIFTPNNDGINDTFELSSPGKLTFNVYNRVGNLLLTLEAKKIIWDGKDERGNDFPEGIYFYTLQDESKTYKENHGFFYLIRSKMKEVGQ